MTEREDLTATIAGLEEVNSEKRLGYMVMKMRHWDCFEPAPGPFAHMPFTVKGEGIGFCVIYVTEKEAEENADGGAICCITISTPNAVL